MNDAVDSSPLDRVDVAIVGGGAGGVLAAIRLLQSATSAIRIALIEPYELAEGIAYATRQQAHLLNVPAGKMSAFAEHPGDFVDYLLQVDAYPGMTREHLASEYVSRRHYAPYLRLRLQQAQSGSPARLQHVRGQVQSLQRQADGFRLTVARGAMVAGAVVLAVGNRPRPLPGRGASMLAPTRRVDAWDADAVSAAAGDGAVCIVGSGLSMVDAVLSLLAHGHRGRIHVLSRHALLPLAHVDADPLDFDTDRLLALPLRARLRALREQVVIAAGAGQPWQAVMERIRPLGPALWQSLSFADQRRFLRHLVRYWDVHRHRIAAPVHARLQALRESGQLMLHRGRVVTLQANGQCIRVCAAAAGGNDLMLDVQTVINATGVEMRAQAMGSELLAQLVGSGIAGVGPHGIGIATSEDGSLVDAEGHIEPRIQVLGSLRIGRLWESLAIPEIRVQAQAAARALQAKLN